MERCEKVTPAPKINMSQHEPRKTPEFSAKDGQWDVNMTDEQGIPSTYCVFVLVLV